MNKVKQLGQLKEEILKDESLPLREGATQLVFGIGNPQAEILFIGEAPGYWEDQKGEPFVGPSGKLLDKTLAAVNLDRKNVFISNVVMYRPPNNRDPLEEELIAFDLYLDKLIEIIDPKLIVTLGRFSMAKFLHGVKITQVHGKLFKVKDKEIFRFVMPMFHPSAALRGNEAMKMFNDDFLKLPKALEKIKKHYG